MRLFNFTIHAETAATTGLESYGMTFSADRKLNGFLLGSGISTDDVKSYVNGITESGANLTITETFSAPQETIATADFVIILEKNY